MLLVLPSAYAQKAGKGGNGKSMPAAVKNTQQYKMDSTFAARQYKIDSTREVQRYFFDSLRTVRIHIADSARVSRRHILDSTIAVRQKSIDSIRRIRRHFADSVFQVRKYRESKKYQDSVFKARNAKLLYARKMKQGGADTVKYTRPKIDDSAFALRRTKLDSLRRMQNKRIDSMAEVRRYKQSKRYFDSVTIVKHANIDSVMVMRKNRSDSMFNARKIIRDSATVIRKRSLDSMKTVRGKYIDSIKAVRKSRADSIAKIRSGKDKLAKANKTINDKKTKLAIDIKLKQKREAWSNETMLKKKWSPPRRVLQNTFTHYNYYYNANRKMEEAEANMRRGGKENYDSLIGLYPFDPNRDSGMLAADMDSIIRKVSVGIQIHDPRTKWAGDMYLLLGQAYYYKGNCENAAISFRYIISMDEQKKYSEEAIKQSGTGGEPSIVQNNKRTVFDILKHKPVHNEAILWLSRTFTEGNQLENAESILSLLDSDPNLPENMKGQLALEKAFVYLHDKNYSSASQQLKIAINDNNVQDWIRVRCAFLNGQILQRDGNYLASSDNFKKVIDLNPKIDMEFYARKNMAYNTMYAGGDMDGMIATLKGVLNDGKYIPYQEQVYYVLGQLAANNDNYNDAVSYFRKSVTSAKSTKKQKAITFASLGNLYYGKGEYTLAKMAYDSSARFASAADNDTLVSLAVKRSKSLNSVVGPSTMIHDQDSLLELAHMTEKEQRNAVRKYLRYLERKRADSIFKAENAGIVAVQQNDQVDNNNNNAASNWYFSNPNLMQQGYNEFKRKWGSRPLADNWRRLSGIATNNNNVAANDSNATDNADLEFDENGIPTEESLLALIPDTDEKQDKARKKIQKAYVDMGNAYIKDLEDYPLATKSLDSLDKKYPMHDYLEEDIYMRYLVALKQGKLDTAQNYSRLLLEHHANSKFAALVRPTEDKAIITDTDVPVSAFYDETYSKLIQYQYTEVLIRVEHANKKYSDPIYKKRFRVMEAIALAGKGNYKEADTLLTEFTKAHPSDSLKIWAEAIIKYIKAKPQMPVAGMDEHPLSMWPYYYGDIKKLMQKIEDSAVKTGPVATNLNVVAAAPVRDTLPYQPALNNLPAELTYSYTPKAEHYFSIAFEKMDSKVAGVRAVLKEMNSKEFKDLNLSIIIDIVKPELIILQVKQFYNAEQAKYYMRKLEEKKDLFTKYRKDEYKPFIISVKDYKTFLFYRKLQDYLDFYEKNIK